MDDLTDQLTDPKSDRAALDAVRAAAADGLRQACADIGGGLEWGQNETTRLMMPNNRPSNANRVQVTLRVPENIIHRIDSFIQANEIPVSRNNWILEAVIERLNKIASEEARNGSQ